MNPIRAFAALCFVVSPTGCTAETNTTCPTSSATSSSTTTSSSTSSGLAKVLEISTCATYPVNPAVIIGGDLFCLALTVYEAVEIRSFSIDIQGGSSTHDLLVGSAGTVYFRTLAIKMILPDSSEQTLMGPRELPPLPASSTDSGIFSFGNTVMLEPGVYPLRVTGLHDRPEDAPNEYKTGTAHYYFAWINDGITPFNEGDVRYASTGDPVPIDRIVWVPDELLAPPYVMDPNLD